MNPATPAPVAIAADFQLVIDRNRELMLRGEPPASETIQGLIASLDANGRWADIKYADPTPGSWSTSTHLKRVRSLAVALVQPKSALYNDPKTAEALMRALDDWIANRYKNPNWWHNDIGVPGMMSDIIILLGDRLSGVRRDGALEVLHQYGKARPGDGANTMWMANLALTYGALTHDGALVGANAQLISNEIRVTRGEGIQADNSYHQHRERLQQFHYGGAFINDAARLGWQLQGTPWAIPTQKLQIVADCILGGSQWMVRGTSTVPGTLDRSVSRPGAMKADLRGAARFLRDALPASAPALDAFIARQDGTGAPLVGFRAYPRSDFAVNQRPSFGFFLKTLSDRTLITESINGENLKGHLLNCGDHYLVRDGGEYTDLPPVWDWDALPGVTYAPGAGQPVRQPFVGSVTDGSRGATTMDVRFATKEGATLTARKLWASHGDVTVCLIADLSTKGVTAPVHTALDQCQLRGPVTICDQNGALQTPPNGVVPAQPLRWIHHSGFVYIPLENTPVALKMGPATGSWSLINKPGSKTPTTIPVFLPTLEHGASPQGTASGFVIVAAPTVADAQRVFDQPTWKVVRNDATCQAIRFDDGTLMATYYAPATIPDDNETSLSLAAPCLVLQTPTTLFLADPTQKGGGVSFSRTMNGQGATATLPSGGLTLAIKR